MTYTKLQEFYDDWAYEAGATQKVFNKLGWHITETISEMLGRTGLKVFSPDMEHYKAASAKDLQECYKHASDSFIEKLKANWKDETLLTEDDMYGEKWKKGATLSILIAHQVHHRGQMTVLMRQAGLKIPGFYGPSYEEWEAMGMEPMK